MNIWGPTIKLVSTAGQTQAARDEAAALACIFVELDADIPCLLLYFKPYTPCIRAKNRGVTVSLMLAYAIKNTPRANK